MHAAMRSLPCTAQLQQAKAEDGLEAQLGFPLFTNGDDRLGWLMNMQPVSGACRPRCMLHALTLVRAVLQVLQRAAAAAQQVRSNQQASMLP
jgi:hypothetical protein